MPSIWTHLPAPRLGTAILRRFPAVSKTLTDAIAVQDAGAAGTAIDSLA